MIDLKFLYFFEVDMLFFNWKNNVMTYGLLIFSIIVLYVIAFYIIRLAVALELIQTLTYIFTVLLLVIGVYVYANVVDDIHIKQLLKLVFESIALFGGLLFLYMVFRTIIHKIKT